MTLSMADTKAVPAAAAGSGEQGKESLPTFGRNSTAVQSMARGQSSQTGERQSAKANPLYAAKVKRSELILFTTQLSVMLDSGVVLSDALDAIAGQAEEGVFKAIIMDVAEAVKGGENFSKALLGYPKTFNSMFVSMVKASEASGKMSEMLTVLGGYLDFESETRKRIKGALTYPLIMALMAVAATGTLMLFVLPRFMKIYESRGTALPKITQILVGISKTLGDIRIMTIVLTAATFASIAFYYWAKTPSGSRAIDFLKIRTPVLGTMFIETVITRSMRIMATMVSTGVSLLDAIEVVRDSCDSHYFRQLWAATDGKIRDGYQLSESIQLSPGSELIAPGVVAMLRAGEKSGRLGDVCDKVSVFYEKKLEASIKNVMTLIEPVMITILGIIIGTIVIALLLPVFRISSVIAH